MRMTRPGHVTKVERMVHITCSTGSLDLAGVAADGVKTQGATPVEGPTTMVPAEVIRGDWGDENLRR